MTSNSGSRPPDSTKSRDRLEATVEMDVREHLRGAPTGALPANPPGSAAPSPASPPTLLSVQPVLAPLRALRVAVRPGSGSQLEVVRLADDQALPPGMQEALLVPLAPKR